MGKFLEFEHRHFPNFLSKNGHGNTCNEMHRLSIQKLLAFLYDLLAVVLTKHTNMCLVWGYAQDRRQPSVGIILGHIPSLIELVEVPVGFRSQSAKLSVCHRPHGDLRAGLYPYIGITHRVVLADIKHRVAAVVLINPFRTFEY